MALVIKMWSKNDAWGGHVTKHRQEPGIKQDTPIIQIAWLDIALLHQKGQESISASICTQPSNSVTVRFCWQQGLALMELKKTWYKFWRIPWSCLPYPMGWPSRAFVHFPPRACIGAMASTRFPGLVGKEESDRLYLRLHTLLYCAVLYYGILDNTWLKSGVFLA